MDTGRRAAELQGMFSSIVVGCDGSPGSLAAIELAQRLRDPADGRLILVSVRPSELGYGTVEFNRRAEAAAQEILRLSVKHVAEGVPADSVSEAHNSVPGGLNDVAEREAADLIVLGPTHHHSLARLAGRMTVQRLLAGAPCAVGVAGGGTDGGRIIVGYDASDEARLALARAYGIAAHLGADVELCQAVEPITYMGSYVAVVNPEFERKAREQAGRELEAAAAEAPDGVGVTTRIAWGGAAEALLAGENGAAMIVTGSRGYGTLRRAIAGSVSGALVTRSEVPVLVTPRAGA